MLNHKGIYIGLIITFGFLYIATAFVSFYHAISFFQLANAAWLSVILSLVFEVGQASVLFSLLLTDNNKKMLPWFIMIILTALQIIGNVFASYKFITEANSPDFQYFQQSILFWLEAEPAMFKVIVAWITGALLPIIALSMTSLVAQNLQLKEDSNKEDEIPAEIVTETKEEEIQIPIEEYKEEIIENKKEITPDLTDIIEEVPNKIEIPEEIIEENIKEPIIEEVIEEPIHIIEDDPEEEIQKEKIEANEKSNVEVFEIKPVKNKREI